MCAITHSYVCHDAFLCVPNDVFIHLPSQQPPCAITLSFVWHDWHRVPLVHIHTCTMTHSYMTNANACHDTSQWAHGHLTMTYPHVCNDSLINDGPKCVLWQAAMSTQPPRLQPRFKNERVQLTSRVWSCELLLLEPWLTWRLHMGHDVFIWDTTRHIPYATTSECSGRGAYDRASCCCSGTCWHDFFIWDITRCVLQERCKNVRVQQARRIVGSSRLSRISRENKFNLLCVSCPMSLRMTLPMTM